MKTDIASQLQCLGLRATPELLACVADVAWGSVVFRAGEPCRRYPVVMRGGVRVCRTGSLGHDVVFYRVQAGEGCAVSAACLLEEQRYPVFGVADSATCALLLPASIFHAELASNPMFRDFVFRQYAARIHALMARVDSLISERPQSRLVRHLLASMEQGRIVSTHAQLAADIGTAREVVSRQLGQWVRAGWLRQRRQLIEILDAEALQSLADGDAVPAVLPRTSLTT